MKIGIDTSWHIVALIPTIYLFFIPVKRIRAVMITFLFWTITISF